MFNSDIQSEIPVSYCESCHGEIYKGDMVYDLAQVYMSGSYIVHEDCLLDSLEENKQLTMQFLFGDLCLLKDVFDELLSKCTAWDIFDDWRDDCDDE